MLDQAPVTVLPSMQRPQISSSPPLGRGFAVALLATLAACATFPRAGDEGGPAWIQVSTEHFALATDMAEGPAREISGMLESWWTAMRAVVAQELGLGDEPDGEPFLVIALRSRWEREGAHYRLGGLFSTFDLAPPVISIGDVDDQDGRETLKHELAHAFLSRHLPRVPRWLNEGMAEYLQTAEVDVRHGQLEWGARNSPMTRDYVEFGEKVSVKQLLAPGPWPPGSSGALEFRAGLLVHMLVNRHPTEFACYLRGLKTDLDVEAPLKSCFSSRARWEYELGDYGYTTWFKSKTAPCQPPAVEPRTTPIGDARVHAVLALLDIAALGLVEAPFRQARQDRSQQNLRRALELDPTQLLAGLIRLDQLGSGAPGYADASNALANAHPEDWRVWVARGRSPTISGDEQQQAMERAWGLAPEEMEVLRLAAIRALAAGHWKDASALEVKAWLKGASEVSDRVVLAIASARLGRCSEARDWTPASASEKRRFEQELARVGRAPGCEAHEGSRP